MKKFGTPIGGAVGSVMVDDDGGGWGGVVAVWF